MKRKTLKISCIVLGAVIMLTVIFFGSVSILKTLYPTHYGEFVEKYAKKNNLSTSFVYAVIKCESNFNPDAVSYADARGLMQLTPDTFRWLAGKQKKKARIKKIFDPETNIRYGCFFYGILMEEYGDERTAIAGYHAGMGNVSKWLKDERYSRNGKNLDDIPFRTTREYVDKVIETKHIYEFLYGE